MDCWTYLAIAVFTLLVLAYYKVAKIYRYFEDRSIPYLKSKFLLGSDPDGVLFKIHLGESWDRIYKKLEDNRVGGFFQTLVPLLMIRDPNYVQQILTSSFEHFMDRNFLLDEKTNPLDAHLFLLRGNKWRFLRNKLSPIFSGSKLRWMFQEMEKCGDVFTECIDKLANGNDIDIHDELARYATDVIGSCAFGLEGDSLRNPDCKLRQIGKEMFKPTKMNRSQISFILRFSIPRLLIWLKIRTVPTDIEEFFTSTMISVMQHRRKTGTQRKDFIQLLLQLQDKGVAKIDTNEIEENEVFSETNIEEFEITDLLLVAQSFVFFLAGFETTSRTLHYLTYLLAEHQEIQERARQEVLQVKAKHGHFTYDALKEMTFLDRCISETLRIYPLVTMLNRECTKDFTFSDGTFIEKGTQIVIPIYSLQRDPKYFSEPLKYDPDRFENEPPQGTYAPFGDGPRICIGKRFAIVEIKIVIARLLEKYKFEPSSMNKDGESLKMNPWTTLLIPINGLWVKIKKNNEE